MAHAHAPAHNQRPWYLNPGVIFYTTWLGVWFLYSLHLSDLLIFPFDTVRSIEVPLLSSFLPFLLITYLLPLRRVSTYRATAATDATAALSRRLRLWFGVWVAVTVLEIIVSGGVPLVWTLTGSSKDYFMFGIPTLHGIMNALILAISITRFTLWLKGGSKLNLCFPLFMVAWSVVVEARQLAIVTLVETALLFLIYRKLRMKRVIGGLVVATLTVVLFGVSGDIRSGGDAFRQLAQPTDKYPDWLPSGFLWVYIYMTTPLNNLVNTWTGVHPLGDITMPNTFAQLVPTAVRNLIGQKGDNTTWTGELVTEAFNVSTGYVGPVQDLGVWGVMVYSAGAAFTTGLCWLRRGMQSNLTFAVLGQCLFLTIFFNHFFFLPIIAQVVWIYVFFRKAKNNLAAITS